MHIPDDVYRSYREKEKAAGIRVTRFTTGSTLVMFEEISETLDLGSVAYGICLEMVWEVESAGLTAHSEMLDDGRMVVWAENDDVIWVCGIVDTAPAAEAHR
jgi:hypothetical protein